MSESEEEYTAITSSDDELDLEDILAYDKEPEYTEEEIAAGISQILRWMQKRQLLRYKLKATGRPKAEWGTPTGASVVRVRRCPIASTAFAVWRLIPFLIE